MRLKTKYLTFNNLVATTALTAFENKIPNVSNLVKKSYYNTKISETENKLLLIMIMINILICKNLIS